MSETNAGRSALTIDALRPDRANHNKGTVRGTALLEDILHRRGFGRPILVDKDCNVIGGNQVLAAAVNAGLIKLKIVRTTGNEVVAHMREDVSLDSKEGRELALADNFIGRASFDPDVTVVVAQAKEYDLDLEACGVSEKELKRLLKELEEEGGALGEGQEATGFNVLVKCESEADRKRALKQLKADGYDCEAVK